jgi:acyl-CoA synthetase (AMP-forming)/AMP-acid ligase II
MPDRAGKPTGSERGVRLLEKSVQAAAVTAAVRAQRRLQLGRAPPPGDEMRVGVPLAPARAEQVVDQPLDAGAAPMVNSPYRSVMWPGCQGVAARWRTWSTPWAGCCRAELARHKVPAYVLFTTADQLPLTVSGRVQKFRLAERAATELH